MKTPVEILEEIIRSKKASYFLRQSTSTEADIKRAAELFYKELVGPYTETLNGLWAETPTRVPGLPLVDSQQLALDFQ